MKRFVEGEDRSKSTLFPERLDEYLAEDNPVKVIDVFVDELNLRSGLTFDISGYTSSAIDILCALIESYTVASFQGRRQTVTRPLRIEFSGALYRLTARGNDRQPIYLQDEDRNGFLQLLEQTCGRYDWLCHA